MPYNTDKLRGRIKERYQTEQNFARELGMGRVSLSKRLNNRLDFSRGEIFAIRRLLNIPWEELSAYFFDEKVHNSERDRPA